MKRVLALLIAVVSIDSAWASCPREVYSLPFDRAVYLFYRDQFFKTGVKVGDPSAASMEQILAAVDVFNATTAEKVGAPVPAALAELMPQEDIKFDRQLTRWLAKWRKLKAGSPRMEVDDRLEELMSLFARRSLAVRGKDWLKSLNPKKLAASFKEMPPGVFEERLQAQLLQHGLRRALTEEGFLMSRPMQNKFENWYWKNRHRFRYLLAVGLAAQGAGYGLYPFYIPTTSGIEEALKQPGTLDRILDEGLEAVLPDLKRNMGQDRRLVTSYNILAKTYTAIAFAAMVAWLPTQIKQERAEIAEEQKQEIISTVDELAQPMSPDDESEKFFNRYVDALKASGAKVDLNSPELRHVRETMRDTFRETFNTKN